MTPRELLAIERAAFSRLSTRWGALVLGVSLAFVGALALVTAVARARFALFHGSDALLTHAFAAAGLGFDLWIVFTMAGLGLAAAAVARPLAGRALVLPALRTSAGVFSIGAIGFFVTYAGAVGLLQLGPVLAARGGPLWARAGLLALAVTPSVALAWILGAAALAAAALVARGVTPGRALASGLDHTLRRPAQALALFTLHALVGLVALGLAAALARGAATLAVAPVGMLLMVWAIAAFDAALARDPRLVSG